MLHVDPIAPIPVQPAGKAGKAVSRKKHQGDTAKTRLIEITFRSVELDGQNLSRELDDVAIGQLAEAIRLADLRSKTELKINNIAPWIPVGDEESCQIPILQKKIEAKLEVACKQAKRSMPECRLDLTHGVFGIRCYLGRVKPTDHVFEEDFESDSR